MMLADFLPAFTAVGGVAASRRTMVAVPSENLDFGSSNELSLYVARPSHMIDVLVEPFFRIQLPVRLTPFAAPSQSRFASVANLLTGILLD